MEQTRVTGRTEAEEARTVAGAPTSVSVTPSLELPGTVPGNGFWSALRPNVALLLVLLAAATYSLYLARLTINQQNGFGTAGFDLGLYDQGIWLLSRFRAPFVTIMGRNLFGDHTSFVLLPLVPFYWFGAGPSFLLAVQSLALGCSAIPIFLTAKKVLNSSWAGCALGVSFLMHPALAWSNAENFHPDTLFAPLMAWSLWALVQQRWRVFLIFAVLCTLVKEDTILVVLPLGLYAWWKFGRAADTPRRTGLLVAGWSVVWTGAALMLLRTLNSVGSLNAWRIPFGGPTGLLKTIVSDPGRFWNYLFKGIDYPGETPDTLRPWYLWKVGSPVLFIMLRAPLEVCLFIFVVGVNVVSNFYYQYSIEYHYTVTILPGLFFATLMGIASLKSKHTRRAAIIGIIVSCAWTGYLWGPTPLSTHPASWVDGRAQWVADGRALLGKIPPDVPISVFYGYIPQVAHRVEVYQFPVPWRDSYYGLPGDDTAALGPLRKRIQWVLTRDVEQSQDASVREAYTEMTREFELVEVRGSGELWKRRAGATVDGVKPASQPVTSVLPQSTL